MAKPPPSTDMGTTDGIDTENGFFCMNAIFLRAEEVTASSRWKPDCEGTGGNPGKVPEYSCSLCQGGRTVPEIRNG